MTLRLRLTLLYGLCFLLAGAVLLAITYGLVAGSNSRAQTTFVIKGRLKGTIGALPAAFAGGPVIFQRVGQSGGQSGPVTSAPVPSAAGGEAARVPRGAQLAVPGYATVPPVAITRQVLKTISAADRKQVGQVVKEATGALQYARHAQLSTLLAVSGIALALMALLSIGLGWLVAGRALRPLRTMNQRARAITEESLDERLGLDGRADELGELAETFDALLARLELAFDSQRRFVANASHELRTPVTLERALVEVALADPDATVESLRRTCERVLAAGEHQERLIDALLTLARGQAGLQSPEPVDLGAIAEGLAAEREFETARITFETSFGPAIVSGDPRLLERLVANLLDNAIAYNAEGDGWVRIETHENGAGAVLQVLNSGPQVPEERLAELFEPFRRLDGERLNRGHGLGLGLSIVRAIATAHRGTVTATARTEGGLELEVRFPPPG